MKLTTLPGPHCHGSLRQSSILRDHWDVPYLQNDYYFGRDAELQDVHARLNPKNTQTLRKVVVSGLPGMGKTQIALQYCFKHRDSYRAIFWLQSEQSSVLQQQYSSILKAFDLPKGVSGASTLDATIAQVKEVLGSSGKTINTSSFSID